MKKTLLRTALVVIAVAVLGWVAVNNANPASREYQNNAMEFGFTYPGDLKLEERQANGDPEQPVILSLSYKDGELIIVPSVRPKADIEKEKAFYENLLFKDGQLQNSRLDMEKYDGFKSLAGFNHSLYTVYREGKEGETLTLRTEITASTTEAFDHLERSLLGILDNLSFN